VTGRLVSFPSGDLTLRGYLHVPPGDGPFPALLWNHGSERDPGAQDALAAFYTSLGCAFFAPHRRGHGRSPGEHFAAGIERRARAEAGGGDAYRRRAVELVIELHERQLEDTAAAVRWLTERPFVDAARLVMSGASYGGIQTILAAEADVGARAYVPFAPAATAWDANPELGERLLAAVRRAAAPMLLVQAENDHSLGPSRVLGDALRTKGAPNAVLVYPPYGETRGAGHADFATRGTPVWGADVRAFLERSAAIALRRPAGA